MSFQHDFLSLMSSGGPVMWVIFVVACMAMALLIWEALRGLALMKSARHDYRQLRADGAYLPRPGSGVASPIAQLLAATHWPDVHTREDMAKEFNIHLAEIIPRVEGRLATIAVLGSLLPMLGLLGTVTGMINVFEVIAIQGSGKPDEMADGISQALLTTASGLIIAIPVIFLHHLLSRRVGALMTLTHQAIQLLLHRDVARLREALSDAV